MNKREFRKRRIENEVKLIDIRRRECNIYESKLQFEMDKNKKSDIKDIVGATLKLVKLEIRDILEEKDKKEE